MQTVEKIDVIVVGAGPAGVAAAVTVARGGKTVVMIDRADLAGSKNMFGGAVYLNSIKDLFPISWEEAPYESYISQNRYSFLTESSSVEINHKTLNYPSAATVFRPKFDAWLIEQAKKEGVFYAPKTTVRALLLDDKRVIGVRTDNEELKAKVVILADGAQSNLAQTLKLRKPMKPKDLILGVKETFYLDNAKIKERFNLVGNQGMLCEYFGGLSDDETKGYPFAMGFLYTFKNHISLGIGINVEDLIKMKKTPYEFLERLKSHPDIIPYLDDARSIEYSAHTLPEADFQHLPKMYTHGAMLVGDACGLVNNIHFEGTNYAIYSGILAGETALEAVKTNNASKSVLSKYEKRFKKSFMYKDMKSYRNVIPTLSKMTNSVFLKYPKKMDEFFTLFNMVDTIPKATKFRSFAFKTGKSIAGDIPKIAKTVLEVLK